MQTPSNDMSHNLGETVGQVHKFGSASESLFRRIYRGLNRRSELEDALRHQSRLLHTQTQRNQSLLRIQEQQQRDLRNRASELERLHAVLGSMDAGIIVQDLDGKVTMMNPAAKTMLGSRRSLRDGELRTLFERYRSVRRTRAALLPLGDSDELMLNHRILKAHLVAVGDDQDERIGTVIILRDITYDALARRLKDGFVSRIAQEMEAPLSLMKLAGDLLNGEPDDAAFNRHLLQKLLANVELLDRLLLELLDVAALNAGNLDVAREPVEIESWVWSVVNGISADIATSGIDLLVMTRGISDLHIKGDDKRLQWALGHVIRNGAQYNRSGGYVAISTAASSIAGKPYATIRVSDNGNGISAADLPHIFERFYRGEAVTHDDGGTPAGLGQGLYVARGICEAHGGFIEAKSRWNVGSAFTIGLPLLQ